MEAAHRLQPARRASTTSRSSTRTSCQPPRAAEAVLHRLQSARACCCARDKSLSKKLLAYHRIPVPEFEVFRIGRPIRRPKRLTFPLIVKSLTQEASIGISQASVVDSDEKLKERVAFIHESIGTAAIAEQYIEGRELYVGILGNQALQALPVWELFFTNMPEGAKRIATDRVKWSVKYQKKYGIDSGPAKDLPDELSAENSAPLQARLPRARAERLRAHRPAAGRGRNGVGARSEPESADCKGRGFRGVSREDRAQLRNACCSGLSISGCAGSPRALPDGQRQIERVAVGDARPDQRPDSDHHQRDRQRQEPETRRRRRGARARRRSRRRSGTIGSTTMANGGLDEESQREKTAAPGRRGGQRQQRKRQREQRQNRTPKAIRNGKVSSHGHAASGTRALEIFKDSREWSPASPSHTQDKNSARNFAVALVLLMLGSNDVLAIPQTLCILL